MAQTTRERKVAFIKSFGGKALEAAVIAALNRNGAEHWLTDEQLNEITSEQAASARSINQHIIQNRKAQFILTKQKEEAA